LVQGFVQINFRLPDPIPAAIGLQLGQVYIDISYPPLPLGIHVSGGVIAVQ
jgi:hypothetical protein